MVPQEGQEINSPSRCMFQEFIDLGPLKGRRWTQLIVRWSRFFKTSLTLQWHSQIQSTVCYHLTHISQAKLYALHENHCGEISHFTTTAENLHTFWLIFIVNNQADRWINYNFCFFLPPWIHSYFDNVMTKSSITGWVHEKWMSIC